MEDTYGSSIAQPQTSGAVGPLKPVAMPGSSLPGASLPGT